jgi:hypothetical protein
MKKLLVIISIGFSLFGCKDIKSKQKEIQQKVEFNQNLRDELSKMAVIDQLAAANAYPPESYSNLTLKEWKSFKDSIYRAHGQRLKEIVNIHGFLGFDKVGKEGSHNFWLMVQHSDHDPAFQLEVLDKMKVQVDNKNANPELYGFLVDRVNLNLGKPQIYGTQVDYNLELAQAFPKHLADSANVNKRRKSIGLESLEDYLNQMSIMHYKMNEQRYIDKGITKPKLYK